MNKPAAVRTLIGLEMGPYRVVRRLGSGGMADVYEAEDQMLGRRVALKVLPPEFGRNPQMVARFEKEIRSSASLNHRGIVTVFDVGRAEGVHYYSMRLLPGGDLRSRMENGPMQELEALTILREVADAFVHAHQRGFVHRDVKPENILFDEQGHAVLTDFGIAKAIASEAKMTATGVSIGTPRYISPEQARGKPVDARADLYSLGVILYEMLVGQPPYDAEDSLAVIFKHVTEPIPRLPDALGRFQPLIDSLMAKDPAKRPASATEVLELIERLSKSRSDTEKKRVAAITEQPRIVEQPAESAPQPATPEQSQTHARLPQRAVLAVSPTRLKRRLQAGFFMLLLASMGGLAWWFTTGPDFAPAPTTAPAVLEPSPPQVSAPEPAYRPEPEPEPELKTEAVEARKSPQENADAAPSKPKIASPSQSEGRPAPEKAVAQQVPPKTVKESATPSPLPTRAASSSAQCTDLMTKFGLGEELTPVQKSYLQANC